MAERQRSPDEIRDEIERTRADMDETVSAIGERLSPGQIVDSFWGRVKHTDAPAAVGDVIRDHPLPAALIGAGLAWLAYDRMSETEGERLRRKHGDIGPGTYERAEGRVGPYRGDELEFSSDDGRSIGDRARSAAESVREAASGLGERVSGAASGIGERVSDRASSVRDRASDRASSVRDRASDVRMRASERMHAAGDAVGRARGRAGELAGRARGGLEHTLDDQPLALGAVAFGLGLASGLVAPHTRWEDERMGRTADRVRDEAKRTGRTAAESARRVAMETKESVVGVFEREHLKEELTDRVKQVAYEVRDAARNTLRESADREGLSGEGLRDRAHDAVDRVRE